MEQKCKAAMSDLACLPPDRLTPSSTGGTGHLGRAGTGEGMSQPQSCAHTAATGRAVHFQSHLWLNTRMMLSFLLCAEAKPSSTLAQALAPPEPSLEQLSHHTGLTKGSPCPQHFPACSKLPEPKEIKPRGHGGMCVLSPSAALLPPAALPPALPAVPAPWARLSDRQSQH